MDDLYILDFCDSDKKRYVFTKKNFDNHKCKHPELEVENFFDRIKKAIIKPEFIYKSYNHFTSKDHYNRYCYYYLEATIAGQTRYTKVVVEKAGNLYQIITAFRPTNVKEIKYSKPLWKRP